MDGESVKIKRLGYSCLAPCMPFPPWELYMIDFAREENDGEDRTDVSLLPPIALLLLHL